MRKKQGPIAIRVEVAYALRDRQVLLDLRLEQGATAGQAVLRSDILRRFPEIDLARVTLGIFGAIVSPDARLRDGDRVEIYRPLTADPKQMRRRRAQSAPPRSRRRETK